MHYFSSPGMFWLPSTPEYRVAGTLTYDAEGASLTVTGSLEQFVLPEGGASVGVVRPEWKTLPVVHGELDDETLVTLLDVSGTSFPTPMTVTVRASWDVAFVLRGAIVDCDLFEQAVFEFDGLMAWVNPAAVAEMASAGSIKVDTSLTPLADATLKEGVSCRLLSRGTGSWSDTQVDIKQSCMFEVTGPGTPIRTILNEWVRPMQDLLVVALGRPVRLTVLAVKPTATDSGSLEAHFAAVQPATASAITRAEVQMFDSPTLLLCPDEPHERGALLQGWYTAWTEHRATIALLCGPYYAPFIYGEHRYASTFQAAEAYARQVFRASDKTRAEHAERVERVREVLSNSDLEEEVVGWVMSTIQTRNDKPLKNLIEELTQAAGELGGLLLQEVTNFSKHVARARTGVSHGAAGSTDALRRYWLGEALTWIVRVHILSRAGRPLEDLAGKAVGNARVRRLVRELSGPPVP